MLKTKQVEELLYEEIGKFNGLTQDCLTFHNAPYDKGKPFSPPKNKLWSKVFINYSGSVNAELGRKNTVRDFGILSIQCFAPKNSGTLAMAELADDWRDFLQSFTDSGLEVYLIHAPQDIDDPNFYAKIIRAEFRVN